MLSLTEENYLKAIFSLNREVAESATTNAIAEKLDTKASSVTDMMKRLSKKDLVNYQKYQAVSLTKKGKEVAISIIRKHRLWELFLVEKLHFKWDEVHDIAEQLEHIKSTQLTDRLDAFLGFPDQDPHGDPIPNKEGQFPEDGRTTLSELNQKTSCKVVGVKDHSSSFLSYLESMDIELNTIIQIKTHHAFDSSMEILIEGKKEAHISKEVAQNLYVE